MSFLSLIWAGLFRRKTRTVLTLFSIIVAFLLFGLAAQHLRTRSQSASTSLASTG